MGSQEGLTGRSKKPLSISCRLFARWMFKIRHAANSQDSRNVKYYLSKLRYQNERSEFPFGLGLFAPKDPFQHRESFLRTWDLTAFWKKFEVENKDMITEMLLTEDIPDS